MVEILQALSESINTKNWYGALLIALTIPDICSKLENPEQHTNIRYPVWFNKFGSGSYQKYLSGKDCYALRCSYLHEGNSNIENQTIHELVDKITLSPDGSHLLLFENIYAGSTEDGKTMLHISVKNFCEDMIQSGHNWMSSVNTNTAIKERMSGMIQIQNTTTLFGGAIYIG